MGRLAKDVKNLILGNDGSDKEPLDFETELQKAIENGLITKADKTLLITAKSNVDDLAELISVKEEKEVIKASKENNVEFNSIEEAIEYKNKKKKKKEQLQQSSLEQQIQASQNEIKAKIAAEKKLEKDKGIERK